MCNITKVEPCAGLRRQAPPDFRRRVSTICKEEVSEYEAFKYAETQAAWHEVFGPPNYFDPHAHEGDQETDMVPAASLVAWMKHPSMQPGAGSYHR